MYLSLHISLYVSICLPLLDISNNKHVVRKFICTSPKLRKKITPLNSDVSIYHLSTDTDIWYLFLDTTMYKLYFEYQNYENLLWSLEACF